MVLLKKHEHFTRMQFRKIIKLIFKDITFTACEAHHYPLQAERLIKYIRFLEDYSEHIPFFQSYLNYNIAVVTNE